MEWIDAAKELPTANDDVVLAFSPLQGYGLARYAAISFSLTRKWYWLEKRVGVTKEAERVTHWLRIPPTPAGN